MDLELKEILEIVCREMVLALHISNYDVKLPNYEEKSTTTVAQCNIEGRPSGPYLLHCTIWRRMN